MKELISCIKLRTFDDLSSIMKPEFPKHTSQSIPSIVSSEPLKSISVIIELMSDVHMKFFIYHYVDLEVALVWSKVSSETHPQKRLLFKRFLVGGDLYHLQSLCMVLI